MTATRRSAFRERLRDRAALTGLFVKLPTHQAVELAAATEVDVVVIDMEHAPIGAGELDAMLAVGHALDLPCLVRVTHPLQATIQQALDGGAVGVVVPHVDSPARAAEVVVWCRYGAGGRGYSGSTRAAGWGARPMADVLADAAATTTVIVQVEDVDALGQVDALVAVPGVDAVFVGVADLAVAMGCDDVTDGTVTSAVESILAAADRAGRARAVFATDAFDAAAWRRRGVELVFAGSDQGRVRQA